MRLEILCFMIFMIFRHSILKLEVRMISKLKNDHFSWSVMLNLLEKDTAFVPLALIAPEI